MKCKTCPNPISAKTAGICDACLAENVEVWTYEKKGKTCQC